MDTLAAARWQMTVSLAFHIVFAAVGIGLPLLLVIVEGLWLRTGREHYRALAQTWAKATGLLFAVGAVSGTALSFELGLLWPRYMELTGAVVGHVFALEGYAFFICSRLAILPKIDAKTRRMNRGLRAFTSRSNLMTTPGTTIARPRSKPRIDERAQCSAVISTSFGASRPV